MHSTSSNENCMRLIEGACSMGDDRHEREMPIEGRS